jgi:hypothetical protein
MRILQAIKDKFPGANVIVSKDIGNTNKENVVYIHNITDFSIKAGFAYQNITRFAADIKTNKDSFSIKATGSDGFFMGGSMKESTERACKDFAEKLSDSIKK